MRLKIILVSLVLLFCLAEGSDYEDNINTEDNADYEGDITYISHDELFNYNQKPFDQGLLR